MSQSDPFLLSYMSLDRAQSLGTEEESSLLRKILTGRRSVGVQSSISQTEGMGPVSAVSANDAPPTGPQECVGQDDATRLGQASKSSKSLFAPVGVQSSLRSQTEEMIV
ncbi:hypothetical protein THAOC_10409 [Thalassiosira oceanica]|uniref:Uncharacterized protein n=1 Tax=Thalassiosira oceanica TaxID=159749 RepID=K0STU9_THAOC|nr:hypothetical protein THAOC_10409 [Thalassiosira oceanica]|eukprot:EJK68414.1 hypothetical protein THAOC_10409 [Thalassiosira oceanica]